MPLPSQTLAGVFLKQKIFDKKTITKLSNQAEKDKLDFYTLCLEQSGMEKQKFNEMIAAGLNVEAVNLEQVTIDPALIQSLPEIVAKKNKAVVFARDQRGLSIATDNPTDTQFLANFKKRADEAVLVYFADAASIDAVLKEHHSGYSEEFNKLIDQAKQGGGETKAEDLPIILIVDKLLELGYTNKASDIHIEPYDDNTLIRFRIDGLLHDIATLPRNLHDLIATRIKILARLRTDEHRAAQDGKLQFPFEQEKVDVRVSIIPIVRGEKIVLRLLSEKARQYDLENLGFRREDLEKIKSNIQEPWGMILATGPTGCGKTTTLYAILKILNKREVNISTIEDPVEYDIEGINQIQVNPQTNLTFALGLRALVRQDPDIIMVGEIRDMETAKIAINSAMTGHLVLSTLHTNDAATTLPRLIDMGIEPFLVASTINIVIAQRLVRKICESCKQEKPLAEETVAMLAEQLSGELLKKYGFDNPPTKLFQGTGCSKCQQTGFKGRVGICELLEINEEIKELIMSRATASTIEQKAQAMGMLPMIEDGLLKVKAGVTTIEEILRVSKE